MIYQFCASITGACIFARIMRRYPVLYLKLMLPGQTRETNSGVREVNLISKSIVRPYNNSALTLSLWGLGEAGPRLGTQPEVHNP